jgi:hypothetical protein
MDVRRAVVMGVRHADAVAATHAIVGVRITRSYSAVPVMNVNAVEGFPFAVSFGVAVGMGMGDSFLECY